MRRVVVGNIAISVAISGALACLVFASASNADDLAHCTSLKVDKQRLACYDKAAKAIAEEQARAEQERVKATAEQVVKASDPNALSAAQKDAAKQAIRQLNKLTAATEVGISYRDYGTRIVDMSSEFKEAIGGLPKSDLYDHLSNALADHVRAREVWNLLIQAQYGEVFEKVVCPDLRKQYPDLTCSAQTDFSSGGRVAHISEASKSQILNGIWSAAKVRIKKAEDLVAAGRLNADAPAPTTAEPAPAKTDAGATTR